MKKFSEVVKGTPYQFQKDGIKYLLQHHYSILADEMGLGKTFQAISSALILEENTVVICPAYLKINWLKEFNKFSKVLNRILIPKTFPIDEFDLEFNNVVIVNYEQLVHCEQLFKWGKIIIADEAQYLKNLKANRTDYFHTFMELYKPERFIALSGTPIKNNVPEFFSLLALCSYSPIKDNGINVLEQYKNFYRFSQHFCNVREFNIKGRRIQKYEGVRNLPELRQLLEGKYIRRLAKDCLDLPEVLYKDVMVDYGHDLELLQNWESAQAGKTKTQNGKHKSAIAKVPYTISYITDLIDKGESPIVVYSDFKKPVEMIKEHFDGGRCELITGNIPPDRRNEIIERYQRGQLPILA
jgi:SNF2 family DNA or RNA helicase